MKYLFINTTNVPVYFGYEHAANCTVQENKFTLTPIKYGFQILEAYSKCGQTKLT